jgi:hemerythrin-like domain-containing protein
MSEIMAWHAEHMKFTRLLKLLEEQVTVFAQGGSPNYTLMRDIVYYLRNFPEVHHHRYENEVYGRMRERDPRLKPLADRLVQQHRVIAECGAKLLAMLEAAVNGAVVARVELEAAAAAYLVYYRAHIDAEEAQMLPPVLATLERSDWAEIAATVEAQSRDDPLFGPQVEQRFHALRLEIDREVATETGHAVAAPA